MIICADIRARLNLKEAVMLDSLLDIAGKVCENNDVESAFHGRMLQGTFQKLTRREFFLEQLYPGASVSVRNTLPQNLHDLLAWDSVSDNLINRLEQMGMVHPYLTTYSFCKPVVEV